MINLIQEAIYKNCGFKDDSKLAYYWVTDEGKYMVALSDMGKTEYYILNFDDRRKKARCANNICQVNDFNILIGEYVIMLKPMSETASITIDCGEDKEMAINFVKSLRKQYFEQKHEQIRREKRLQAINNQTKSL